MAVEQKDSVKGLTVFRPARTIESVCREYGFRPEEIIKLAGNENRFGTSPKVLEALQKREREYSFYPDTAATRLREILAEQLGIGPGNITLGEGSFELIEDLAGAYLSAGQETVSADPSFGWYITVTRKNEGIPVRVPVRASDQGIDPDGMIRAITPETKIVWICNPNNPTGTIMQGEDLVRLVNSVSSEILIVIDEAYLDFAEEPYIDTIDLVKEHDNVVLLRTFSKAYGLAGFRLGFAIGPEDIIEGINKVRLPFSADFPGMTAAEAALQDPDFLNRTIQGIREGREAYYAAFREFGWESVRSNGNFIFVHSGVDGTFLEEELLKRGILIRKGIEFGTQYQYWFRISVGTPGDNEKVIRAFRDIREEEDYPEYLEPGPVR